MLVRQVSYQSTKYYYSSTRTQRTGTVVRQSVPVGPHQTSYPGVPRPTGFVTRTKQGFGGARSRARKRAVATAAALHYVYIYSTAHKCCYSSTSTELKYSIMCSMFKLSRHDEVTAVLKWIHSYTAYFVYDRTRNSSGRTAVRMSDVFIAASPSPHGHCSTGSCRQGGAPSFVQQYSSTSYHAAAAVSALL